MNLKIIFALLFFVFIVSGCLNSNAPSDSTSSIPNTPNPAVAIECGTQECFNGYLIACTPAHFVSVMGTEEMESTIEGVSGNDCVSYYVATKSNYPFLVGADLRCRLPREFWATQTEFMKDKTTVQKYCTGNLLDYG